MKSLSMASLAKPRSAKAFAIRFADQLISPLHQPLALLEPLKLIDQFFAGIGVVTEDGSVGINGGRAATKVVCLVVLLLGLSEASVNAVQMGAVAFL
jgi:hypothetical protein